MSDDVPSRSRDDLALANTLSDEEVIARVNLLAGTERGVTAVLIAHLAVLDERRLYRGQGFPSMFAYCTEALHLSEYGAYGRIQAARAARQYPAILNMLADGSANLTTVGLIAPHLTPENHAALLGAIASKSKRQVEELVVRLRPRDFGPSSIRKLPESASLTPRLPSVEPAPSPDAPDPGGAASARPEPADPDPAVSDNGTRRSLVESFKDTPAPLRHPGIVPVAPARYKVQFIADAETCEQLRLAQDMLRHQIPDGDISRVIARAVAVLVQELARRKFAATTHPRRVPRQDQNGEDDGTPSEPPAAGGRRIPAAVKRAVWLRDGGRCAFVAPNGRRCGKRAFLEFHHAVPHAMGGEASPDNIALRCRAHNQYEAELYFGPRGREGGGAEPLSSC